MQSAGAVLNSTAAGAAGTAAETGITAGKSRANKILP